MVEEAANSHGDKTHGTSGDIDKTASETKICQEKSHDRNNKSDAAASSNNVIDTVDGSNKASDEAGDVKTKNNFEGKEENLVIDPDNPLLKPVSSIQSRFEALAEEVALKTQEDEEKKRVDQKKAYEFSSERLFQRKFLEPIYDDNGEIIGYKNPLHIGHLDLRVGQVLSFMNHPKPSKQCRYVETVALHPYRKNKSNDFYGSPEDLKKIENERKLKVESGLPRHYRIEDLLRLKVIVVCNVKPFTSRGVESKVVVLCARKGKKTELLQAPQSANIGDSIVVKGYPKSPQTPYVLNIAKHIEPDLRVNNDRRLVYKNTPVKIENKEGYITTESLKDCGVTNVMGYDFI